MKPIKVVCFYWIGERWVDEGMSYNTIEDTSFRNHVRRVGPVTMELASKYVNNLFRGIQKWTVHPFDFICFTNENLQVDKEIEIRPLKLVTRRGVLPRMYMFSEEAGLFGHQVLSLDLDIVVTGSMRDIMNYDGLFCVRKSWDRAMEHTIDGDIMSFRAGKETEDIFWKPFINDIAAAEILTQGRERFWVRHVASDIAETWQDITPGQVVSYKKHVQRQGLPEEAKLVSCHGFPRPHQINEQWRKKEWK